MESNLTEDWLIMRDTELIELKFTGMVTIFDPSDGIISVAGN